MKHDEFIERHILTGLIVSTEFLSEIEPYWNPRFIKSTTIRIMTEWCLTYYREYRKAPEADIEGIYFDRLKKNELSPELAEELEEDILPDLSDEFEHSDNFNVQFLIDKTYDYFSERNLELHQEQVEALKEEGKIKEAENLSANYKPVIRHSDRDLNLADKKSIDRIGKAFEAPSKPLIKYPGALGEFLNPHLVRDAFVSLLAPEKRGKSFTLLDAGRRAVRQRLNVAFFQAGDVSELQQLRRLAILLAKRSDQERFSGVQFEPVKDCIKNQADTCSRKVREKHDGLHGEHAPMTEEDARRQLSFEQLRELYDDNPKYRACHNCSDFKHNRWGCSWIDEIDAGDPLEKEEAMFLFKEYFVKKNRNFMLSTHANDTLSVTMIDSILDDWYRKGFIPDVIIIDYADLLTGSSKDYRQLQNEIWKGLRRISEQRHCLVLTATQADASAYARNILTLNNFSEDKRKFAHVTSMFGLNQDPEGKEKEIGIMRLNCLIARESPTNQKEVVHVLQNLKRGQPVLTSYW